METAAIILWTWRSHCTHELRVAVVSCLRPAQDQASPHCSMDVGGAYKAPSLAKELLAVDCC